MFFSDTDKIRCIIDEAFRNKFFNIDETCQESGLSSVYEKDMAIVGIRFEVCHFVQLYLNQFVSCIEKENGVGCFKFTHQFVSYKME